MKTASTLTALAKILATAALLSLIIVNSGHAQLRLRIVEERTDSLRDAHAASVLKSLSRQPNPPQRSTPTIRQFSLRPIVSNGENNILAADYQHSLRQNRAWEQGLSLLKKQRPELSVDYTWKENFLNEFRDRHQSRQNPNPTSNPYSFSALTRR